MKQFITITFFALLFSTFTFAELPQIDKKFKDARVYTQEDNFTVTTGIIERTYQLTAYGLKTVSLKNKNSQIDWVNRASGILCDWDINGQTKGKLVNFNVFVSDDEKFTDQHLCAEAEFEYPEQKIRLKYIVWAYPGAEGLRTQLKIKALEGFNYDENIFNPGITESIQLSQKTDSKTAFGYMQGIKTNMDIDILTEKIVEPDMQKIDWANGIILSDANKGILFIKESNKHTSLNEEDDVATGEFIIGEYSLEVTGAGGFKQG